MLVFVVDLAGMEVLQATQNFAFLLASPQTVAAIFILLIILEYAR
jgi:hypothetical protein